MDIYGYDVLCHLQEQGDIIDGVWLAETPEQRTALCEMAAFHLSERNKKRLGKTILDGAMEKLQALGATMRATKEGNIFPDRSAEIINLKDFRHNGKARPS
jgi:hypothetical protein